VDFRDPTGNKKPIDIRDPLASKHPCYVLMELSSSRDASTRAGIDPWQGEDGHVDDPIAANL